MLRLEYCSLILPFVGSIGNVNYLAIDPVRLGLIRSKAHLDGSFRVGSVRNYGNI